QRGGFGNSKVLAPEFRAPAEAYLVSRWLLEKASARLRRDGRVAGSFSLHLSPLDRYPWARTMRCAPTQDTLEFMRMNRALWRRAWPEIRGTQLLSIGVRL